MLALIGFLAGLSGVCSYVPYVHDIYVRTVRPERGAWLIWSVLAVITLSTQVSAGANNSLWLSLFDTGAILLVSILSLWFGQGGMAKKDCVAFAVAGFGLLLWALTDRAVYALLCALLVDSCGFALVVAKAYRSPQSETYTMWSVVGVAALVSVAVAGSTSPLVIAYPLYLGLCHFLVVAAICVGRNRQVVRLHPARVKIRPKRLR